MNDSLVALIQMHLERYPEMDFTDVYKLLHQAAFGSGTPDMNKKVEREWLASEYRTNEPDANCPLIESVSPDSKWVRLHLRPYMAAGGKIDPLLDTFMQSAKKVEHNTAQMASFWREFEALAQRSDRFPTREVLLFGSVQASQHWPAIAHSPGFVRAYRPLYRVLVAELAYMLCEKQAIIVHQ